VGVAFVADREDVNAETFATIDGENYTVARVYGAWKATPRVTVKARIENALDEKYEQVHGYPQPGFGAFGGVEWKF
jgi:vitamin B12 transporter